MRKYKREHPEYRERSNRQVRERYRQDPTSNRNSNYRKYGITVEQYDELLKAQFGTCAICKRWPEKKRLAVDHDHKTGKVRGLLCNTCNRAIGLLGDDPEILSAAITYLLRQGTA